MRTTSQPYREWPWHARVVEKLYRWTHGGQIRTLVIRSARAERWAAMGPLIARTTGKE